MNKRIIKIVSLLLGILLISGVFSGCKKDGNPTTSSNATESSTDNGKYGNTYPLKSGVTLTYWIELSPIHTQIVQNYGDTEFAKELEKETGVKIEYLHPSLGQSKEQFSLLAASGDLPDMIFYNWSTYPGGGTAAINDDLIYKLNDIFDQFAPSLKKHLQENPEIADLVDTEEKYNYVFPQLQEDKILLQVAGPILRKDWLDDLGLPVPTTMDEWYTTLKAFKEKKNAEAPLTMKGTGGGLSYEFLTFSGAFDSPQQTWLVEDGVVKYGSMQPGYRDFVETMRKWYAEGLIDKNFAATDDKLVDANMLGGRSGAAYNAAGAGIGTWLAAMKGKDSKFDLVGAPYPTLNKGERRRITVGGEAFQGQGTAISKQCKDVELAARWLDYAYSPKGHLLYSFGIEGVSYNMVGDYPTYTDVIKNNPDGLSMKAALLKYSTACAPAAYIQDKRYLEQFYGLPQQQAAQKAWTDNDHYTYMFPTVSYIGDEATEMSNIMTILKTYESEKVLKIILGIDTMEDFDKMIEKMKKLKMDRAIEINQAAYERYLDKKNK